MTPPLPAGPLQTGQACSHVHTASCRAGSPLKSRADHARAGTESRSPSSGSGVFAHAISPFPHYSLGVSTRLEVGKLDSDFSPHKAKQAKPECAQRGGVSLRGCSLRLVLPPQDEQSRTLIYMRLLALLRERTLEQRGHTRPPISTYSRLTLASVTPPFPVKLGVQAGPYQPWVSIIWSSLCTAQPLWLSGVVPIPGWMPEDAVRVPGVMGWGLGDRARAGGAEAAPSGFGLQEVA